MRSFREKTVAALPLALPLFIRGIRNIAREVPVILGIETRYIGGSTLLTCIEGTKKVLERY